MNAQPGATPPNLERITHWRQWLCISSPITPASALDAIADGNMSRACHGGYLKRAHPQNGAIGDTLANAIVNEFEPDCLLTSQLLDETGKPQPPNKVFPFTVQQ
ncbi:uncharacterized protein PG998_002515 [Apiospora kogelbergensis]|uniref:Uncharacterized protein n=1 Tax=Apiospora kogelbergensis TaxID=1337665 RepID=A0AAW0Q6Q4_9PEZI